MTGPDDPQYPDGPQFPGGPQYGTPQGYPPQPYPGQGYPGQGYPGQGHPAPTAPHRTGTFWARFGSRLAARPRPRLGVTLAGVGIALSVLGVVVWATTYALQGTFQALASGHSPSSSRHFLGARLALLLVAIGYATAIRVRSGPLNTAGIAAGALGVPILLEFLTYDGSTPIDVDVVVWLSVLVWLASYALVPATRGHTFFLGLTLLALWEYALDKVAPEVRSSATFFGLRAAGADLGGLAGPSPDATTIGSVSLVFGAAYYAAAWWLDRSDRHAPGTAFAAIGFVATAVGIGALAPDAEQVGTGILLLVIGVVLAAYGARFDRRFTTWVWGAAAAAGSVLVLLEFVNGSGTTVGIGLIMLGVAFVALGVLAATALRESDGMPEAPAEPGPPVFAG